MSEMNAASTTVETSSRPPTPPLWLLALICFSGTLAMHIFVPVLPLAGKALAASPGEMQLTISFYIFGLAVGQLIYGPVSDRFGRRPVLMVGLVIYTLAGLVALFSPDVHTLIISRLFQAVGGCAGLVIGRAIVRDTSATEESTRRLALLNLMITVGPGLAPIVGSLLSEAAGWRAIFVFLCLLGGANLLLTWRTLQETSQKVAGQSAGMILRNYGKLLKTPAFLGYAIGGSCATTSLYAFVAAAPFIFTEQLNRPSHEIGFYIAMTILGIWGGSLIASRLAGRIPSTWLLTGGNLVSLAGGLIFLTAAVTGHLTLGLTIGPIFIYTLGAGIAAPAALAKSIGINPLAVGSASGLYGFMQMAIGAVCTALAGLGSDHALSAATIITLAGIVSQICFLIANRAERAAS